MERAEFVYMIKEVWDELREDVPDLKIETYRDGGSMAFFMPDSELIMLAPIQQFVSKNHVTCWFNSILVLKEGCKIFSDSTKDENIIGRIVFDSHPIDEEKREKYKNDIKMLLKSLRLNKYISKNKNYGKSKLYPEVCNNQQQ